MAHRKSVSIAFTSRRKSDAIILSPVTMRRRGGVELSYSSREEGERAPAACHSDSEGFKPLQCFRLSSSLLANSCSRAILNDER